MMKLKKLTTDEPNKIFPTWVDLLSIVGVFIVANVLVAIFLSVAKIANGAGGVDTGIRGGYMFIGYTVSMIVTILYAVFYRKFRTKNQPQQRMLTFRGSSPQLVLWGLVLILACGVVIEPLLALFPDMYFDNLSNFMEIGTWSLLTAIVMAPVLEEILFRAIIQRSITLKYGGFTGVLLGSVIFALIHLNPVQVVNAFFVGIILGYIYYRTNSLFSVILIHAINNALAYVSWMFNGEELLSIKELLKNNTLYYMIYGASLVILVISLERIYKYLKKDTKIHTPNVISESINLKTDESSEVDIDKRNIN